MTHEELDEKIKELDKELDEKIKEILQVLMELKKDNTPNIN